MKKFLAIAMAGTLALTLSASAFPSETDVVDKTFGQKGGQGQMQMEKAPRMDGEKLAELEVQAEDMGLTLQEYMQTLMPEEGQRTERANKPEMGEKPEGMTRQEPTAEQKAEMEAKRSEMEAMKAEKMAELEAAAVEAGLTLEAYMETMRPEKEVCPQGVGQMTHRMGQQGGQVQPQGMGGRR